MKVLMAGSSGMVGQALSEFLIRHQCPVVKLVRRPVRNDITELFWNPQEGELDKSRLEEFDAVINLAGYGIAQSLWSSRTKRKIFDSRVKSTRLLAEVISTVKNKPKVFINASGINVYGNSKKRAEAFDEESKPNGKDFLSDVIREWEKATLPVKNAAIRVVHSRFSLILGRSGGLLKRILPLFKMAAGGKIGSGAQIMSWIDLQDAVEILYHCMENTAISGPVNVVAPNPISNKQFTKALATAIGLPAFLPLPEFLIKAIFAEMGESLMLSSIKCKSIKLTDYKFKFPTIRECLNNQLGVNVEEKIQEDNQKEPAPDENTA